MKESVSYKIFNVMNIVFMLFIIAITFYPFIYIISISLSQEQYILAGQVHFLPKGFNFAAYRLVFEHPTFVRGYMNTLWYTFIGIVVSLFMTTICAYPLSKRYLPGRKIMLKFIMFTMFFGGGLIPNFLLVKYLHMTNTVWAITVPGAISVWNVMIMMAFFQGIPDALEEAAYIDGLGTLSTLWYIVLPLSKPILATMILFFGVGQWNNWFGPLIYFNQNEKYPITLFLRNILMSAQQLASSTPGGQGVSADQLQLMPAESLKSAAIVLVTAPILALYPFAQKYFVKGVMIGSIK